MLLIWTTHDFSGASGTTNFFQKLVLTVVPVQFSKINANCNSNGALISWTTTQETNTNYFDVEKVLMEV